MYTSIKMKINYEQKIKMVTLLKLNVEAYQITKKRLAAMIIVLSY